MVLDPDRIPQPVVMNSYFHPIIRIFPSVSLKRTVHCLQSCPMTWNLHSKEQHWTSIMEGMFQKNGKEKSLQYMFDISGMPDEKIIIRKPNIMKTMSPTRSL